MLNKTYKITKDTGLNARMASELVALSGSFTSNIKLTLNNITVDFKSIMGVMSLNIQKGELINLSFDGADEEKALYEIDLLISSLGLGQEY